MSFANGAFTDLITNWALSVERLGVPFAVGALDAPMARLAQDRGWPYLDVSALVAGNSSFFRTNSKTFRNMGATKVCRGASLRWRRLALGRLRAQRTGDAGGRRARLPLACTAPAPLAAAARRSSWC